VVHLVASAVPGLEADHVAVVTTEGNMLHRPRGSGAGDADGLGDDQDSRAAARSYETALEDRVKAMLERVVGPGHADVRVTADLDPARVERLEEHFDPAKPALRSEEQSIERSSGEPDDTVAGVPGAESNLPGGAAKGSSAPVASASASVAPSAAPAPVALAGPVRESHTRNFELDHVTEKRTTAGGALRRLTVAVMLDGVKGDKGVIERPRAELDRLAMLIRSAAGANDARGDLVTVESLPFALSDAAQEPSEPAPPPRPSKLDLLRKWAPYAAGAILLLALMVVALRRRAVSRAAQGEDNTLAATPQLAEASTPPQLEAAPTPILDVGDLRARAHARAGEDPATAALVLRFWLGTDAQESAAQART